MSDTLDMAAIKARAEAATKGKWGVGNGDTIATDVEQTSWGSFRFGQIIASLDYLNYAEALDSDDPDVLAEQIEADAEHIAGMDPPTTLALLAEVERLTAERDALQAAVVKIDAWARGNYGGAKSPAEVWPELDTILRAALSDAES